MTTFRFDRLEPDDRLPQPGDLLLGPNIVHRVVAIDPVDSRRWLDRWRLTVERVGWRQDADVLALVKATGRTHRFDCVSYRRGEGPEDFASPESIAQNTQRVSA